MPTVLVIDESRGALDAIGRILRDAGFTVALASSGHEALRVAERRAIDLVVADLRLTDIAGLDVLRRIRRHFSDIPVIVTGLASTASAFEAGKLGVTDYVEKPVFPDRLVNLARSCAGPAAADEIHGLRVSPQVIHALRTIEERHAEPRLQVGTVAHHLGVSTEHLCRLLKRHTGQTFMTLLRRARIGASCRLLETTRLSMKEIAGQVGFSSASRFNRDFKSICGVSPSVYRANRWQHPRPLLPTG